MSWEHDGNPAGATLKDYIRWYNPVHTGPGGTVSMDPPDNIEGMDPDHVPAVLGQYLSNLTNDPSDGNTYPIDTSSNFFRSIALGEGAVQTITSSGEIALSSVKISSGE